MSSTPAPPPPPFRAPAWLREHARSACLGFWARSPAPRRSGGHFHCLRDDGSVYDARTRHLVSSTRLVVQWAWALRHGLAHPVGHAHEHRLRKRGMVQNELPCKPRWQKRSSRFHGRHHKL